MFTLTIKQAKTWIIQARHEQVYALKYVTINKYFLMHATVFQAEVYATHACVLPLHDEVYMIIYRYACIVKEYSRLIAVAKTTSELVSRV